MQSIQNNARHCFQACVSTAIWICCAVWFKSEQPSLSQTDSQFKSVALHRFAVKKFDCFLEWPLRVIARWPAGAQTWTLVKLKLCCLTNGLNRFYLPRNPRKICVEFEFFFSLLKTQKLRTSVSWYQPFPPWLLYSEAFPLLHQYWQPKTRMWRIHCIFLSLSDKKNLTNFSLEISFSHPEQPV